MKRYPLNYYDNDLLRHFETLEELKSDIGQNEIYKGCISDSETNDKLTDFFLLDRLGTYRKRFLWLYRRRINVYYPIYKDQLDLWASRKTYEWFYDNVKGEWLTHDGVYKLDEWSKTQLLKEITKNVIDNFTQHTDEQGTSDTTEKGKTRQFAFNYPESNYTGGVIPYDIDSNPSVEFINTQQDAITKNESHTETQDEQDISSKDVNDTKQNENADNSGQHGEASQTNYIEHKSKQGDNINKLLIDLLDELPSTDFFRQFTDKLKPCFQNTYLVDEVLEEEGYPI